MSELYFSTMAFFGMFALVSVLGSGAAYAGSACSMEVSAGLDMFLPLPCCNNNSIHSLSQPHGLKRIIRGLN